MTRLKDEKGRTDRSSGSIIDSSKNDSSRDNQCQWEKSKSKCNCFPLSVTTTLTRLHLSYNYPLSPDLPWLSTVSIVGSMQIISGIPIVGVIVIVHICTVHFPSPICRAIVTVDRITNWIIDWLGVRLGVFHLSIVAEEYSEEVRQSSSLPSNENHDWERAD